MKKNTNIRLLLLSFLLSPIILSATVLPLELEGRIAETHNVVIARVLSSESYWDIAQQNIFTAYTLQIKTYLKKETVEGQESLAQNLELIVPGGIVGDEMEIHSPKVELNIGEQYLIIGKKAQSKNLNPKYMGLKDTPEFLELHSYIQGVLPYHKNQYVDYLKESPMTEKNLIDKIKKITLQEPIAPTGAIYKPEEDTYPDEEITQRPISLLLKNGQGAVNPVFYGGTIEEDHHLIIEGNGFGNTIGTIEFPNSNSGGRTLMLLSHESDIISWTDQSIRVKIPSTAGSGNLLVKNSSGTLIGTGEIQIAWSLYSIYSTFKDFEVKTRQNIKLTDRNQEGGYTIQLNIPSQIVNSEAIAPLERAMNTWSCNTGINWQLDKTGTNDGFANDGNSVIMFEPNLPAGILGITTSRYKASGSSSCNEFKTVWYLKEFDIQFLGYTCCP